MKSKNYDLYTILSSLLLLSSASSRHYTLFLNSLNLCFLLWGSSPPYKTMHENRSFIYFNYFILYVYIADVKYKSFWINRK
jgi:hypothetical protein